MLLCSTYGLHITAQTTQKLRRYNINFTYYCYICTSYKYAHQIPHIHLADINVTCEVTCNYNQYIYLLCKLQLTILSHACEQICLPHCTCMSHCTTTIVYMMIPNDCKNIVQKQQIHNIPSYCTSSVTCATCTNYLMRINGQNVSMYLQHMNSMASKRWPRALYTYDNDDDNTARLHTPSWPFGKSSKICSLYLFQLKDEFSLKCRSYFKGQIRVNLGGLIAFKINK